jgi:hypothetical protein
MDVSNYLNDNVKKDKIDFVGAWSSLFRCNGYYDNFHDSERGITGDILAVYPYWYCWDSDRFYYCMVSFGYALLVRKEAYGLLQKIQWIEIIS